MIEVAEGYARNFLLPKGMAVAATADAINTMNLQAKAKAKADAEAKAAALAIAEKLKGLPGEDRRQGRRGRQAVRRRHRQGDLRCTEGPARPGPSTARSWCWTSPSRASAAIEVKARLGYEVSGTVYVHVMRGEVSGESTAPQARRLP